MLAVGFSSIQGWVLQMTKQTTGFDRVLALALLVLGVLVPVWLFGWNAMRRPDVSFLPQQTPAEWIVFPSPADVVARENRELATVFKRSFKLERAPSRAALRVAGFREYSVQLNGTPLGKPAWAGRNWKQPDRFQVSPALKRGEIHVLDRVNPWSLASVRADSHLVVCGVNRCPRARGCE